MLYDVTRWWFALYAIFLFLVLEFMLHFTQLHFPVCSIDYTIFDMLRCRLDPIDSLYDQFRNSVLQPPFIFAHFAGSFVFFSLSLFYSCVCFVFSSSQDLERWRKKKSRTCLCTHTHTHVYACVCVIGVRIYTLYAAMHERTKINQYSREYVEHWTLNIQLKNT